MNKKLCLFKVGLLTLQLVALGGCGGSIDSFLEDVSYGRLATVQDKLKSNPKLVNTEDASGESAINRAVDMGDVKMVRLLIENGADVNHDCPRLGLPLHAAASAGDVDVLEELLRAHADVKRQPHTVSSHSRGTALHVAARGGQLRAAELLLAYGADPNARDPLRENRTPLMEAYCPNPNRWPERRQVAALLFKHGADLQAKDKDGHTAFYWAKYNKAPAELLDDLRQRGISD